MKTKLMTKFMVPALVAGLTRSDPGYSVVNRFGHDLLGMTGGNP